MNPKEKAKELFDVMSSQTYSYQPYAGSHYNIDEIGYEAGKKCALIAVSEIIKAKKLDLGIMSLDYKYWEKVKLEIEKL